MPDDQMIEEVFLTDDERDYALQTAITACQVIVEDETSEEYFAGQCEDAIPLLDRLVRLLDQEAR